LEVADTHPALRKFLVDQIYGIALAIQLD
jgi:hypothetical protein